MDSRGRPVTPCYPQGSEEYGSSGHGQDMTSCQEEQYIRQISTNLLAQDLSSILVHRPWAATVIPFPLKRWHGP